MPAGRILVVEDEEKLRRVVQLHLESLGFEVDGAASAEQALPLMGSANVVLTDLRLPGMDGIQLIKQLQARGVQAATVVMTAHGSVETAVEAMKLGAADFLQKPFSLDHLTTVIEKVMAVEALRDETGGCEINSMSAISSTTLSGAAPRCATFFRRLSGWLPHAPRFCWRAKAEWART